MKITQGNTIVFYLLFCGLAMCTGTTASAQTDSAYTEGIRLTKRSNGKTASIKQNRKMDIKLRDSTRYGGRLRSVTEDSIVIQSKRGVAYHLAKNDIKIIQMRRSTSMALLGIGGLGFFGGGMTGLAFWVGAPVLGVMTAATTVTLMYLSTSGRRYVIDRRWVFVE